MKKMMYFDKVSKHQRVGMLESIGYFSGIYYVSGICIGFPTLGPQAAFCKLKSVTDLQLGPARFPVTMTTVYMGVEEKTLYKPISL
jgi:hypothetical protein